MTRTSWSELRDARMASPEAQEGYASAKAAYEFGRVVRERREEIGMSQSSLAKELGTSQPAIARLEAGGTEPTLRTIVGLSRALGKAWVIGPNGIEPPALPAVTGSKRATA